LAKPRFLKSLAKFNNLIYKYVGNSTLVKIKMKKSVLLILSFFWFLNLYSQNRELNLIDNTGLRHGVWESTDSLGRKFYILFEHGEKQWQFYSAHNIRYAGVKSFKSIDEGLKEPLQVIRLSLHGQSLNTLSNSILEFKNLEVLSLGENPELDWNKTFELLSGLDSLRWLFLEENQIKEIPNNISKLKELRTIWLNDNEIQNIPIEFNELEKLEEIRLENNELSIIPEELRKSDFKKKIVNNWLFYEGDFEVMSEKYNYQNNYILIDSLENKNSFQVRDTDTINRIDSNGLMQGLWKVKYHNQRSWQVGFENGLPNGKFFMYDYDGSVILQGHLNHGKKTGLWKGNVSFANQDTLVYDSNGQELGFKPFKLADTSFQVGQVYYLTGLSYIFGNLLNESEKDSILKPIVYFLNKNKEINIEIIANCGIDQSNHPHYSIVYSSKAARSIFDYLIENGIEPQRLKYSTNEDFNYKFLIPRTREEIELNKRFELRITKTQHNKK